MEITYNLSQNFLGDATKYSADLYNEPKENKQKFHGLDEMHVELIEQSLTTSAPFLYPHWVMHMATDPFQNHM